ncbi:MAG: bifunctional histidinol-phosphatase/imidazoleglycerol-phosphate dehydratase HisB [Woeseiaceae bacterium]|nr:bifunctional histidinol-phosphatase/imidazoleglycerol-phosphate dehydratase HisB [Woeseiaceae bacterium]
MSRRILFLDRDGTLIREPEDFQVDCLSKVRLTRGVIPALLQLGAYGYRFVMVTNQDGLGTHTFPNADFDIVQEHVLALFASQGIEFDEIFVCPHRPDDGCDCRKPRTGLLTKYLASTAIDAPASCVIGDRESDLELAGNLGMRGFRFDENGPFDHTWPGICQTLKPGARRAERQRRTRETDIRVAVDLDATGPTDIATGIGFFDHMLEQIAKHGGFRLQLTASGDLHVDDHHTVEDSALAIGGALRDALGDKRGIERYGFQLPMDEAQASVSLDLSGRAFFVFRGKVPGERVGGLATELVPHFFRSLADSLGAALHIEVSGDNAHHMIEACFKGVGRALRMAIRREGHELPSTKGVL